MSYAENFRVRKKSIKKYFSDEQIILQDKVYLNPHRVERVGLRVCNAVGVSKYIIVHIDYYLNVI